MRAVAAGTVGARPVSAAAGRRLRILHVVLDLEAGGLERLVADMVRRADRERFDVHVLALRYLGRNARGLETLAGLHEGPRSRGSWSMVWPRRLAAQIRGIAPDVVHTHSGVWYKASLAARLAGVPRLVHTDHGRLKPDPWRDRLVDGLASRRTDVVVAVSESLGEQLARTVVHDPSRIVVVLNGVDTERFRPRGDTGRVRGELAIPADAPIIGSIGRLDPIKAYDVMVEAFGLLRAGWTSGPPPVLVLAGDGPEQERLDALVRARGLDQAVRLTGWRDDVHDLHGAFTLFSLSSWSEGTSVSLLEAMSAGVCPVVTRVGGNPAVLGARLEHRLVAAGDPAALAAAWRDALLDPEARRADARVARQRVEEAFALDVMVRRYEALYRGER
jgi:glycosyltransferase involved in cell wall biosynthesis